MRWRIFFIIKTWRRSTKNKSSRMIMINGIFVSPYKLSNILKLPITIHEAYTTPWSFKPGVGFTNDFLRRNSNSMETSPCNSIAGHQIVTMCAHSRTAQLSCTVQNLCDHCIRIEVRVRKNFHRIGIAIEKPLVKRGQRSYTCRSEWLFPVSYTALLNSS